jgi:hypothetical protein
MKACADRRGLVLLVILVLLAAVIAWALLQPFVHHVPEQYTGP